MDKIKLNIVGDITRESKYYNRLLKIISDYRLSKKVKFSIELKIEKGRGYVSSEENNTSSDVDFISIDSVFTPIINVKYSIENTRVEQKTDFEKLILDIQTDGSIHPEDALKGSAQLLIKHFYLFSDKDMEFAEDNSDEIAFPTKLPDKNKTIAKLFSNFLNIFLSIAL